MHIKIKYFTDVDRITKIEQGDWIDLRCSKDIEIKKATLTLIPLGVAMQLPEGYEAHVVPRSSTFKHFGLIQANSVGIIDESYCGDNDQWHCPVLAAQDILIKKNERICQFRIMEKMPELFFEEVEFLDNKDRGGFGSTGK